MENLINEKELAARLGLKMSTLRRWRWSGEGPSYVKLGEGQNCAIRYQPEAIEAWLAENAVRCEVR